MFKSSKISLTVRGILFAALGILCFCFPQALFDSAAVIAGVFIIICGVVFFCLQYRDSIHNLETMRLSASVLMVALGVLIIFRPTIVAVLLGVFVLFEGIDFSLNSIKYYRARTKGWWGMLLLGLAVIIMGCWGIFSPEENKRLVGILIGISFLAIGLASFIGLAGLELVEDYFEQAKKALDDDEAYEETEVVK